MGVCSAVPEKQACLATGLCLTSLLEDREALFKISPNRDTVGWSPSPRGHHKQKWLVQFLCCSGKM